MTEAADSNVTSAGTCTSLSARTAAYSAYVPAIIVYATRSPTRTFSTSGPTSATVPAPSEPSVNGSAGGL